MATKNNKSVGDQTPVIGGVGLPDNLVVPFVGADDAPDDDLGRQAYWLLKLNPNAASLKFRKSDLTGMDDDTKRLLISDIQFVLGIAPLKTDVL